MTSSFGRVSLTVKLVEVHHAFGTCPEVASATHPYVLFAVYRETAPNPAGKIRQWAFQIDYRTLNGYVIYVKDNETSAWEAGWQLYDFAGKDPEW